MGDASRSGAANKSGASKSYSARFSRSMSSTGKFLKDQLWIYPILAIVVLGGVGWWVNSTVEKQIKQLVADQLQTILRADAAALSMWIEAEKSTAQTLADGGRLREQVQALAQEAAAKPDQTALLVASPLFKVMQDEVLPQLPRHQMDGYFVVVRDAPGKPHRIIASGRTELIGRDARDMIPESFWSQVFDGKARMSKPYKSVVNLIDVDGVARPGVPTMLVAAPVYPPDSRDAPLAAIAFRLRPSDDFSRILQVARLGDTGEVYAFDDAGRFLSQSRFDDQLKRLGLLADVPGSTSALTLEMRNPGVDMVAGGRPTQLRSEQPLTRLAEAAVKREPALEVDGYPDYRGVLTAGASLWLPEYDFGLAAEVDWAEAFAPLVLLRWVLRGLLALLLVAAVAIWIALWMMNRMREEMRNAVIASRQLGQYTLETKLGQGGMGVVYRAKHALLRRPTAVKLLSDTDRAAILRFEREVQLTSQLSHPNTVAIYDYGHTPEGVFYYAMEYLDGLSLDQLVRKYGPLSDGRVVYILRQVCGSLREAHEAGLVHRDVKPGNILINARGGVSDLVKVLDFGLVKAPDGQEASLTAANSLTGTPQYLSPEGVQHPDQVDARSDLYAVGAVGYFLLTGRPVFEGESVIAVCMNQVNTIPEPPSRRLGKPISADLEALLLKCLEKRKEDRPQTAQALSQALGACSAASQWTEAQADSWWREHKPAPPSAPADPYPVEVGQSTSRMVKSIEGGLAALAGSSPATGTKDSSVDATAIFESGSNVLDSIRGGGPGPKGPAKP